MEVTCQRELLKREGVGAGGQNFDLGATTQNGGQMGVGVLVVPFRERVLGEAPASSGTLSFISKAVSFVCASSSSLWLTSVCKHCVFLVPFPTFHRATQPFAHNHR